MKGSPLVTNMTTNLFAFSDLNLLLTSEEREKLDSLENLSPPSKFILAMARFNLYRKAVAVATHLGLTQTETCAVIASETEVSIHDFLFSVEGKNPNPGRLKSLVSAFPRATYPLSVLLTLTEGGEITFHHYNPQYRPSLTRDPIIPPVIIPFNPTVELEATPRYCHPPTRIHLEADPFITV